MLCKLPPTYNLLPCQPMRHSNRLCWPIELFDKSTLGFCVTPVSLQPQLSIGRSPADHGGRSLWHGLRRRVHCDVLLERCHGLHLHVLRKDDRYAYCLRTLVFDQLHMETETVIRFEYALIGERIYAMTPQYHYQLFNWCFIYLFHK